MFSNVSVCYLPINFNELYQSIPFVFVSLQVMFLPVSISICLTLNLNHFQLFISDMFSFPQREPSPIDKIQHL